MAPMLGGDQALQQKLLIILPEKNRGIVWLGVIFHDPCRAQDIANNCVLLSQDLAIFPTK